MRTLFLVTGTSEVEKYTHSLANLKLGDVGSIQYDIAGIGTQSFYDSVKAFKPDLIVYIGSRFGIQPDIATLATINARIAPMIHLCSDAADVPWHDLLRAYHQAGSFTLQVAIDGNKNWPSANYGMTLLTPVEPEYYVNNQPHVSRPIVCGFAGNTGGGPGSNRTKILIDLMEKELVEQRVRSPLPHTYKGYCRFLESARISLNIAYSGTEQALQVKGRVVESALAGCCLLETAGAPTSEWFVSGEDYLEYENAEHAASLIRELTQDVERSQKMADNLRNKVIEQHLPEHFWNAVLNRIGMR